MKPFRPLFILCHMFISIQSLITLQEANKSAFDYLRFKHSRLQGRIGNDQIQMPTTVQDMKLATLDPKLYKLVKDPVQKKFTFTLDDAVTRNEIFDDKQNLKKKFPQTTTTTPMPVIKGPNIEPTVATFLEKLDTNLFGIDLKSKFNQLKGALNVFVSSSDSDQVSSQTNRRYHAGPRRLFPRKPGFRARNHGKFVPYFTLPKYLHQQQRHSRPPSQAPPPAISREYNQQEDPNADLESFENFGQDYTKSPDNHNDPPEFTTPSAKYKYIHIQHQGESYLPVELKPTSPPILPTPLYHHEGPRGRPKLFRPPRKSPFPFLKFKPKYRRPVPPVPIDNEIIPIPVTEEPEKKVEQPQVSPQLTYAPDGFLINSELPKTKEDEKTPTDRGVKTRFFTRITDVTTEGGDDPPIRTIVSQGPFIYDDKDLTFAAVKPFEEEDKIDQEIPIYMNDIARDDDVERIDWAKGPATYNNAIRGGTMRPAYYPERDLARVQPPYRRVPEYDDIDYYDVPSYETQPRYHQLQASPTTTPVYEAVQDALKIHNNEERPVISRPLRYEERPIMERPRSSSSEVTGPHNFIQNDRRHLLPGQRRRLRQQQPNNYARPLDYNSVNDEEVQEKFHDDRRRNLQSFFKDNNIMDDANLQHPMMSRYSIDDTEETDRIIPPPRNFARETDEEDEGNDDFESNFAAEAKIKDPFEFPSHFFAKESGNEVSNPFGDPDWDSFFNGHADNIEKDIHSLSRGADDHTAPPEDYQQSEENQQGSEQTPEYEVTDYEQVPEVPNYREQDSNGHHEYPDYDYYQHQKQPVHSRDYDEYGQPSRQEDYNDFRHTAPGSGQEDYNNYRQPSGQGDYSEYDVPRNINDPDYNEYVDYDIPESRTEPPRNDHENRGYEDYFASDGAQGDFFGPAFDDFFQKVENGVEDEITSSPNYHPYNPRAHDTWEQDEEKHHKHHEPDDMYQRSFDKVTYDDLRPNDFDNNHPDTIDFQMPSHDELQKKYKTVSTSASELIEHVVQYQPSTRRPIKKHPIKRKRRFRLTSKHR